MLSLAVVAIAPQDWKYSSGSADWLTADRTRLAFFQFPIRGSSSSLFTNCCKPDLVIHIPMARRSFRSFGHYPRVF
jgi:hypothetical protein